MELLIIQKTLERREVFYNMCSAKLNIYSLWKSAYLASRTHSNNEQSTQAMPDGTGTRNLTYNRWSVMNAMQFFNKWKSAVSTGGHARLTMRTSY